MTKDSIDSVAELAGCIAALTYLPAADRAARARSLIDEAKSVLSGVGDQAVYEMTRSMSLEAAADILGVSKSAINKAVTRYRSRHGVTPE